MKRLILSAALLALSFNSLSATHFIVADVGEVVIGASGLNLALWDKVDKKSTYFTVTQSTMVIGDCEVAEYSNDTDQLDLFYVKSCDSDYPFVTFARELAGKVDSWKVDASRYMYITKDKTNG